MFRVTQRREEGGRRQRWPGGEEGESKEEREIEPVSNSLCALHSLQQSEGFTELQREEKRREEKRREEKRREEKRREEKRRGSKEIEVTREETGVKRGETNLASNQFPKCSPQPGTHK